MSDEKYERKIQWLEKNDYQESDVLVDSKGREYVIDDNMQILFLEY